MGMERCATAAVDGDDEALRWYETGDGVLRVRPDGIVECRHHPGAEMTVDSARRFLMLVSRAAMEGQRRPLLVIVGGLRKMDREARLYLADNPELERLLSRAALVVSSPVGRVIASIVLSLHGSSFPHRVFKDRAKAEIWLLGGLHD